MGPEAILFDEPTSALDPVMAGEVLSVMTDLAKAGQTMIVVTHQMDFARNVSDHVYVFAGGHIVEGGAYLIRDVRGQEHRIPHDENTRIDRPAHVGDRIQSWFDRHGRAVLIRSLDEEGR